MDLRRYVRTAGRAGRLPQLDRADLRKVERRLAKGPLANGYPTDMWTLQRVAEAIEAIEAVTGVAYHPGHVWRVPRQMGWSRQRPARRAIERDDEANANQLKEDWLRVKNSRRRKAWICFQDESGFSLLPSVRATWALRGKTPVLHHHFSWKCLSISAAVGFAPDGSDAWLVFAMRPGAYNQYPLIEFLKDLHDHLGGDKLTLIWDGLPPHRSTVMKTWIAKQRTWLVVERLPAYGHDLNPVELIWGILKSSEPANLCPDAIEVVAVHAGGDHLPRRLRSWNPWVGLRARGQAPSQAESPQASLSSGRRTNQTRAVEGVLVDRAAADLGRGPRRAGSLGGGPHHRSEERLRGRDAGRARQSAEPARGPPQRHNAESVLARLVEHFERVPASMRLTLTRDQGREMARHAELAGAVDIDVFFTEPHHPWQQGANENFKGLVRRYVGKGTHLPAYSQ